MCDLVVGDFAQHIGEPSLRINAVELGGFDKGVGNCGSKRVFVHWTVEHFDWPGRSAEEMFRYNKVINEYEFPPLEVLHFLLISLRLRRHFKGEFRFKDMKRCPPPSRTNRERWTRVG